MFKRFFVTIFFAIVFIFAFVINTYASDDNYLNNNDITKDEDSVKNDMNVDELDYVLTNYTKSIDIFNQINESEEETNNRDIYYGQIYGYIRWTDDYNVTHALEGASVSLVGAGNYVSTVTDNTGFYSLYFSVSTVPPTLSFEITIYSGNANVKVFKTNKIESYKKQNTIYLYGVLSDVYNYTFDNLYDGDVSRAMQILSAMQNYYNYASSLVGGVVPACKVVYPHNEYKDSDYMDYCFYRNDENTIYLRNEADSIYDLGVYSSWDLIGHEYGHHIQYHYFNKTFYGSHDMRFCNYYNFVVMDSVNYPLPLSEENKVKLKQNGCGLALKESWPTFFAITAQKTFSTDIKTVPTVDDTSYTVYNNVDYDIGNLFTSGYNSGGESTERVIMSILYNLYDSNNLESWDNISIDDYDLFDFMCTYKPENLSEFLLKLIYYSNLNVSINDIGKMLSAFQVSPYNLSIYSYANSTHGQGFIWYRGNSNLEYGIYNYAFNNNLFGLEFYDENDNLLLNKIVSPSNPYLIASQAMVELSLYEWNLVLQCTTSRYYVVVVGYASNYYSTGPFHSERYYFNIPTTYDISLSNSNYYEKQFTICQDEEWLFNIRFDHSGYELIQTFGSNDTIMSLYSDYNVLLYESDNDGYGYNSLLYYSFNANETYHLYVRHYNQNVAGVEKITIVPCSGEFFGSLTTIDDFYDISILNNQNNHTYQTSIPQYESKVLLWTPYTSGNYVIHLDSQFDNMLYVINPESSNLLVEDVDYCDDYCIDDDQGIYYSNAELRNYYSSNNTYFIIISKYDSTLASGNITMTITKVS
ncbi:MAG: hypothetical protein IJP63_08300 [Acholeplasmatales bacterium]|nr:hypothetical protein [Acholeplasmatales bacterium]